MKKAVCIALVDPGAGEVTAPERPQTSDFYILQMLSMTFYSSPSPVDEFHAPIRSNPRPATALRKCVKETF